MESERLEKLKELAEHFDERDKSYQRSTEKILEVVGPTVLEALFTLFNAPTEQVTWMETQLVDDVMMLVASIAYKEDQPVPAVIQALSPMPEDGRATVRMFRVGVPIAMIFQPIPEIVTYLTKTAGKAAARMKEQQEAVESMFESKDGTVPIARTQSEFDTSELSHEQIQQLLIFGNTTKGIKH